MATNSRMQKEPMPDKFTTVVSESSNLGFSASTPARLQMLTWWLPQRRALTNAFSSCSTNLRFDDAPSTSKCFPHNVGTLDGLTLELAVGFDHVHIENALVGGLSGGVGTGGRVSGTANVLKFLPNDTDGLGKLPWLRN